MDKNSSLTQKIIAVVITLSLMGGAYFIVTHQPSEKMTVVEKHESDSDIVTNDAKKTAAMFIEANGTMGDIEKDITKDSIKSGEAVRENEVRRIRAFRKVEKATIPGSPLIRSKTEGFIKRYTRGLDNPYIFSIKDVTVSEPSKPVKLVVSTDESNSEYDSVDVLVSFDSVMSNFTHAKDTSYDGTHTQMDNVKHFDNVKVTLVQSGDLWFVYDIEDVELEVNERFATWRGIGDSTIDHSESVMAGEIKIPGITAIDETELPNDELEFNPPIENLDDLDDPNEGPDPRDIINESMEE